VRVLLCHAGDAEAGEPPNPLARIRMRQALRHGAAGGLATKLVDARGDLWRRVFDGLATAYGEHEP
jgi:hypothetical protein